MRPLVFSACLLSLGALSSGCAEQLDGDWVVVPYGHQPRCAAESWVTKDHRGGLRVHESLAHVLGLEDAPAFGDEQITVGMVIPHAGGSLASVPGPKHPGRSQASRVYWSAKPGAPLEEVGQGLVGHSDERGLLRFGGCFSYGPYAAGSAIALVPDLETPHADSELVAGPFYGVCLGALAVDQDGVVWVTASRSRTKMGLRANQEVQEFREYLARVSRDGQLHYEYEIRATLREDDDMRATFSQLVIHEGAFYVSSQRMAARRIERLGNGFTESAILPRGCRTKRRAGIPRKGRTETSRPGELPTPEQPYRIEDEPRGSASQPEPR